MITPVANHQNGEGWHLHLKRRHLLKGICFFAGVCLLLLGVFSYREGLQNQWAGVPIALLGVLVMVLPFGRRPAPMSAQSHPQGLLLPTRPPSLRRVIAGSGRFNTPDDQIDNWLTVVRRPDAAPIPPDPASLLSGAPGPSIDAATFGVDPYVVLAAAQFYLDHPEARGELTTSAAVPRVESIARDQHRRRSSQP